MTDHQKKPDEPEEPMESLKGFLQDSFKRAKANTGQALDSASRELRDTLKAGEKAVHKTYQFVEDTVGKERVIGAVLGSKAGGTIGMVGGVKGIIAVGTVGAVAGFIGGRRFVDWYNKDPSNEAEPPPEQNETEAAPEPKKPSPPEP